ncbi:MAG: ATP-binding cassette domain-containing protein [Treponema sp.]|jgi:simple sugar transport system ATP-binding protein|nr:ATP-binding cassette domain-containing protein [Treponema sp.]
MVGLRNIRKYFPGNGVHALEGADFTLKGGEIHALLGENGAGKSTLMHIMAGCQAPSSGSILVDGRECSFKLPSDALAVGIGMVRQYPQLVPGFKVWEDCILGSELLAGPFIRRRAARKLIEGISRTWGFDLDLDAATETLTVSRRQKAAILALLLRDVRYLIFDEPTAALSPDETEGLFALFRLLRSEGRGIALISHKLEETLSLADRVTVIVKGRTLPARQAASLSGGELGALMFGFRDDGPQKSGSPEPIREAPHPAGRDRLAEHPQHSAGSAERESDTPLFTVSDLWVEEAGRPFLRNISFSLYPGRILGAAGVRDSGLETLELTLSGFLKPRRGQVVLNGAAIAGKGVRAFREAGGAYLGANRRVVLAAGLSVRDNTVIHAHRRALRGFWGRLGFMDRTFLTTWTARVIKSAGIALNPAQTADSNADSFSGGMQQRLLLAREFAEHVPLLILGEPGWGLDSLSHERFAEHLRAHIRRGNSILLFSTDVDELLSLADEILVLYNGEITARVFPRQYPDINEARRAIAGAMV